MVDKNKNGETEIIDQGHKLVIITILGGMFGGIVSLIAQWDVLFVIEGVNLEFMFKMVISPAIQGAVAAILGVFLFSPGKPEYLIKTFSFALACGLAFPAYIQKAAELGTETKTEIIAKTAIGTSSQVYTKLKAGELNPAEDIKQLERSSQLMSRINLPKEVIASPLAVSSYIQQNPEDIDGIKNVSTAALNLNATLDNGLTWVVTTEKAFEFAQFNQSLIDKK